MPRRVTDGTPVRITVNGRPVAEIGPVRTLRPRFVAKADLTDLVINAQADPGLTADIERLGGETTDDPGAL